MKPIPTLIKAIHPADLLAQVKEAIAIGNDMIAPTFVSHEGLICQFVVPTLCLYEYKLITAMELDDLESQAAHLIEQDYDFLFNVVLWNGMYLQWMQRMNNTGLMVAKAATRIAEHSDKLTNSLVEGARTVVQLVPASQGKTLVTIPYPLAVS